MKVVGKIRQHLFRGYFRLRSNIHVHHWRGHGIHSPFMYGIVRNVFMKSRVVGPDRRLYEVLRRDGIEQKQAVKIQNLYTHCRMNGFQTIASGECLNRIAPDQLCTSCRDIAGDNCYNRPSGLLNAMRRLSCSHPTAMPAVGALPNKFGALSLCQCRPSGDGALFF